jgi:hypothetical protein
MRGPALTARLGVDLRQPAAQPRQRGIARVLGFPEHRKRVRVRGDEREHVRGGVQHERALAVDREFAWAAARGRA